MTITIMGGDLRQHYAARALTNMGYDVYTAPLENPVEEGRAGDVLLLPVPATKDGRRLNANMNDPPDLQAIAEVSAPRIFGGGFSGGFMKEMRRIGKRVTDLLDIPSFVEENAVLTAEAALGVGMEAAKRSLRHTTVGVIGYGRIASRLTRLLLLLGAEVLVFARREDARLTATLDGATAYPIEEAKIHLPRCRLLYNTAPAPILDRHVTSTLTHCSIVELASGRENITLTGAPDVTLTFAHSLPGKILSCSAGEVIASTLHQILKKEG